MILLILEINTIFVLHLRLTLTYEQMNQTFMKNNSKNKLTFEGKLANTGIGIGVCLKLTINQQPQNLILRVID